MTTRAIGDGPPSRRCFCGRRPATASQRADLHELEKNAQLLRIWLGSWFPRLLGVWPKKAIERVRCSVVPSDSRNIYGHSVLGGNHPGAFVGAMGRRRASHLSYPSSATIWRAEYLLRAKVVSEGFAAPARGNRHGPVTKTEGMLRSLVSLPTMCPPKGNVHDS